MASKQINHPGGVTPSWANDTNIVDPGEPWDATPTKVEPGGGKRDDGYLPEENPNAQHLNQQFNELGKWIQYFSVIQAMNWLDAGLIGGADDTGESLVYDEGISSWIWGGRSDSFVSSRDGQSFSATFNSGTARTWHWGATKRPGDAPSHTGARSLFGSFSASAANTVVEFAGAFNAELLPHVGTSYTRWGVWDRINSKWLVAGVEDTAGTPTTVFWYDSTPTSAFTKTTPTVAPNSLNVIHMCHGETTIGGALNVAVGDGTSPNFDVWTSTTGTTWTATTPTGLVAGETARSIAWCPQRRVFVLLTNKSCYTSTNGTSWSNVSTFTTSSFQFRCLDTDGGGLWLTCGGSFPTTIRYSIDGGATWRVVAIPRTENGSTDPPHNIFYARGAGRFGVTWTDGAVPVNSGQFSLGLAVGESIYGIDAISIPTVT
jgi:hypothetical protein